MIRDFYTIFLLSMIIGGCDKHVPKVIEPSNTPVIENTASQEHAPEIREFDPQLDIGSISSGEKCQKLRILNDSLMPGDTVQIVRVESPQETALAKIAIPVDCPESKRSAMGEFTIDSESDKEIAEYLVEFDDKGNEFDFHLGIAIVNTESKVVVKDGVAELDITGKAPLRFRDCTSHEGLHLTVWAGKPLVDDRIWHAYQHFLYGTEPTCRREEVGPLYPANRS